MNILCTPGDRANFASTTRLAGLALVSPVSRCLSQIHILGANSLNFKDFVAASLRLICPADHA